MAVQPITLRGIVFDPAQLQSRGGYGFLATVTVDGVDYIWQHAMFVAGLGEIDDRMQAAGGGVFSAPLTWDAGTAASDPGSGRVRAGDADLTAATALHVSETDANGTGIAALLAQMAASSSVQKSQLRIAHRTDATKWALFLVSAAADNGAWRSLTVTPVTASSASPFADGDALTWSFVRVGDAGSGAPAASETEAGLVRLATPAEVQAGTDTGRAVTPAGLASRTATADRTGLVKLATNAEVQAGTDTGRAITPAGLASRTATADRTGLVKLATNAEVQAGTDTERAITPAGLASRTATADRTGLVKLAANAEVQAGTDTERAVTPAGLASLKGRWVPIGSPVVVSSPVAVVSFSLNTANFDLFRLVVQGGRVAANGDIVSAQLRVGGTWADNWTGPRWYSSGTGSGSVQALYEAGSYGWISANTGNAADRYFQGSLELSGMDGAAQKTIKTSFLAIDSSGNPAKMSAHRYYATAGAATDVRIIAASGNLTGGTFTFEGRTK